MKHYHKINALCKEDENAMMRYRYNRIPYPSPDTKQERTTHNLDGIK